MSDRPFHDKTKDPYADPTGVACPSCKWHMIVYNGNYFCSGANCEWALPQPDPWRKTKKNKALEQRCIDGLMERRRAKAEAKA